MLTDEQDIHNFRKFQEHTLQTGLKLLMCTLTEGTYRRRDAIEASPEAKQAALEARRVGDADYRER